MFTRRIFLASVAPGAALVAAGCTPGQIAQAQQNLANFVDDVNNVLRAGCSTLLPAFTVTANTVEAVAAVLYPSVAAAVAAGALAVTNVANAICSAVPAAPVAQLRAKSLKARKLGLAAPVIGNININGQVIPIHGYTVK